MRHLYLNKTQFEAEINKCLHCSAKPCQAACPVHCSPCDFIALAKENRLAEAAQIIREQNPLGHCCGLGCPDHLCQRACIRGKIDVPVNIPAIQAYILNQTGSEVLNLPALNGKKVAVIGSGPAGLGAAWQLLKLGYEVTVLEKEAKIGGAMALIPEFRLPYEVIEKDWRFIAQQGRISSILNKEIENPEDLIAQNFSGVVCAFGLQKSIDLNIEGEEFAVSYIDYLKHPEDYATKGKVAIVGGGNVAADCAFTAEELGAKEVSLFIRRKIFNMKVTPKEMNILFEKKIHLIPTTRLCKVQKEDNNFNLFTCSTEQTEKGFQDIENSIIERKGFSLIIKAIGGEKTEVKNQSSVIYAGDVKTGASTIVEAVASGIDAALTLHQNLIGERI